MLFGSGFEAYSPFAWYQQQSKSLLVDLSFSDSGFEANSSFSFFDSGFETNSSLSFFDSGFKANSPLSLTVALRLTRRPFWENLTNCRGLNSDNSNHSIP